MRWSNSPTSRKHIFLRWVRMRWLNPVGWLINNEWTWVAYERAIRNCAARAEQLRGVRTRISCFGQVRHASGEHKEKEKIRSQGARVHTLRPWSETSKAVLLSCTCTGTSVLVAHKLISPCVFGFFFHFAIFYREGTNLFGNGNCSCALQQKWKKEKNRGLLNKKCAKFWRISRAGSPDQSRAITNKRR